MLLALWSAFLQWVLKFLCTTTSFHRSRRLFIHVYNVFSYSFAFIEYESRTENKKTVAFSDCEVFSLKVGYTEW